MLSDVFNDKFLVKTVSFGSLVSVDVFLLQEMQQANNIDLKKRVCVLQFISVNGVHDHQEVNGRIAQRIKRI